VREKSFVKTVLTHHKHSGRKLPWRRTKDPYKILVSEIMLQQTQVERVVPKYKSFIKTFPSFAELARAPLKTVLAEWSGLGYNRRALQMKHAAEIVMRRYSGTLPRDEKTLRALPGVGPYTARALLTFIWNEPRVFIETNIRSVFITHFANLHGLKHRSTRILDDEELLPLIEKTLDIKNPREWYAALMDYGAHLKKTLPNPSRKSAHHTRQSAFKGSKRQARGVLVKALTEKSPQTLAMLARTARHTQKETRHILATLIRDGLVTQKDDTYSIS